MDEFEEIKRIKKQPPSSSSNNSLPLVYPLNYIKNVPMFNNVRKDDLNCTMKCLLKLYKDVTPEKVEEDSMYLSKLISSNISEINPQQMSKNKKKDKRLRTMEEETKLNFLAFIELCCDQVDAPTIMLKGADKKKLKTSYGKFIASYNHRVPKFWVDKS